MKVHYWFEAAARACGEGSFFKFGKEVGFRVRELVPDDITDDEWSAAVRELSRVAVSGNDKGVQGWFAERLADHWERIPEHRRRSFTEGVINALIEVDEVA